MDKYIQAAEELRSLIKEFRPETEKERQLPQAIISALTDSNLFRLQVIDELGGAEIAPVEALQVYESLAMADASVAWCVWNSSLPCLFGRFLTDDVRREIFGNPRLKYASSTRPTGKAVAENGAYRITGRWSMVSGCMHADWVGLMCLTYENGEIRMTPDGSPEMRMAFIKKPFDIKDTWFVSGLRGTGSNDVEVEDVHVEGDHTFTPMDPVYIDKPIGHLPIAATMSSGHAAICLGIAQAALDAVAELGRSKVNVDPVPKMPDRSFNQYTIAEAAVKIDAMRDHLHKMTGMIWHLCLDGQKPGPVELAKLWSTSVTTARTCQRIVSDLYEIAGATAVYESFSIERERRDIDTMMQHVIVQRFWMEEAGKIIFGLEPSNPLFFL